MPDAQTETAAAVLTTVPLIMRTVRAGMRGFHSGSLSVPQFRTLGFVHRNPGASLSDASAHIGLTLPSMSRLVDGLVEQKLMLRQCHPDDRRRVTLELTAQGRALWQSAREFTQASLADRLSTLDENDRATVTRAMQILSQLFGKPEEKAADAPLRASATAKG